MGIIKISMTRGCDSQNNLIERTGKLYIAKRAILYPKPNNLVGSKVPSYIIEKIKPQGIEHELGYIIIKSLVWGWREINQHLK